MQESDDENDHDPAFSLLLNESESLKETFQEQSLGYGHLKYELRRAVAYFNHGFGPSRDISSLVLAVMEITDAPQYTLGHISANCAKTERRQKEFFGFYVRRFRTIFGQLELLIEHNDSLLDKLGVLHYPVEEITHIARRDKLVQSHNNLDFLIKDLCDEISILLSSSLVAHFSE